MADFRELVTLHLLGRVECPTHLSHMSQEGQVTHSHDLAPPLSGPQFPCLEKVVGTLPLILKVKDLQAEQRWTQMRDCHYGYC